MAVWCVQRVCKAAVTVCCAAGAGSLYCVYSMRARQQSLFAVLQGRVSGSFDDRNEGLLAKLTQQYPNALSLEMETFHLFDLARCSGGKVKAAAVAIALAERYTNHFIAASEIETLEKKAGFAALTALTSYQLAGTTQVTNALTV